MPSSERRRLRTIRGDLARLRSSGRYRRRRRFNNSRSCPELNNDPRAQGISRVDKAWATVESSDLKSAMLRLCIARTVAAQAVTEGYQSVRAEKVRQGTLHSHTSAKMNSSVNKIRLSNVLAGPILKPCRADFNANRHMRRQVESDDDQGHSGDATGRRCAVISVGLRGHTRQSVRCAPHWSCICVRPSKRWGVVRWCDGDCSG